MKTIPEPDLTSATPLTPAELNDIRFGRPGPPHLEKKII